MTHEEALNRLQALCSLKEICASEAESKLRKWQIEISYFPQIINALLSSGYIDQKRYAAAFVADKSRLSKWGAAKIRQALRAKNIPDEIVAQACAAIDPEQTQTTLNELLIKKLKTIKSTADTKKTMAALIRYGASRGFEYEMVYKSAKKVLFLND
ncbi:MAG: RecX family transcriptional regulator [Prevotellaceae bacterium]|jgi:regulatory protein|nr:RecX family transcriptional regulator [Prevotellaceae bacterium]